MRMRIGMNRAQREVFCGVRETLLQRALNLVSPLLLLAAILAVILRWKALPERIPIHYNLAGEADGYGGRGSLLLMPLFGLIMDLAMAIVWRFPQSWNMGLRKTAQNAPHLYHATRDMLAQLRFLMALYFAAFALWMAFHPERLSLWLSLGGTALIFLPLILYLIRLGRIKRL